MKIVSQLRLMVAVLLTLTVVSVIIVFPQLQRSLKVIQLVLVFLNLAILAFIWITSQRKIAKPLSDLNREVESLANGDLRTTVDYKSDDEIGLLSQNMSKMVRTFDNMINGILASANNAVSTVDILRRRTKKTAEGAREQSGQAAQIATASEEMSQTITDIAKNASTASDTSIEAMDLASEGSKVADGAVETVNSVYTSTVELASMVGKLNGRVGEIGDIVTVIKDIADQTNLLALNAAIEAARAGEQGRGFAVVADEVRKLAERTIKATAEISEKIGAVQGESEQTSKSMEEASNEVTKATQYIRNVGDSLQSIVAAVQKVRDQITQIATAVDEQSAASEEVTRNIEKTSGIAKNMEKISQDVMHEVNKLAGVADELRNATGGFKTKGSELLILELARTDHRTFMDKIGSCLSGDTRLDPSQLPNHHTCRFGTWYDGEGKEQCGTLVSFKNIGLPHERIHSLAKEAVMDYNRGDRQKAEKIYDEMEQISDQIGSLLDGIKRECRQP
ncbi:MAG TPA: methyl-accepting chemotaxis protein [Thermodesulfovibrionales bacterium]|jgi:methyl-accepting chemotaxis protein|nr:methyl-accepting chemotaxis protein [Thermodesulfovibrionales bacterium]